MNIVASSDEVFPVNFLRIAPKSDILNPRQCLNNNFHKIFAKTDAFATWRATVHNPCTQANNKRRYEGRQSDEAYLFFLITYAISPFLSGNNEANSRLAIHLIIKPVNKTAAQMGYQKQNYYGQHAMYIY